MKTRKELKDEYKQMKFKVGVFQIRNTVNNKIFVESSTDLVAIWNRIRFQLNAGMHPNIQLQKEWNEFGAEQFVYEILSEIKQEEDTSSDCRKEARQLEELYLEELQPYGEKGYNVLKKSR